MSSAAAGAIAAATTAAAAAARMVLIGGWSVVGRLVDGCRPDTAAAGRPAGRGDYDPHLRLA